MILKKRTSQFCNFHKDWGRVTDMCRALKNQIENHIDKRNLSHFCNGIKSIVGPVACLVPPTRNVINIVFAKI